MDSFSNSLLAPEQDKYWRFDANTTTVVIGVNHGRVKDVGFNSIMISGFDAGFEKPEKSVVGATDALEGSANQLVPAGGSKFFCRGCCS